MKTWYVLNTETRGIIPEGYADEESAKREMYKLREAFVLHSYMVIFIDTTSR